VPPFRRRPIEDDAVLVPAAPGEAAIQEVIGARRRALRLLKLFVPRLSRAPLTGLGVLAITGMWLALRFLPAEAAHGLLLSVSTNMHHLSRDPWTAVFGSMVTLASPSDIGELLVFVAVLAPVERLAGMRRMVILFMAGHVLASYASEFGEFVLHELGMVQNVVWNRIDVGPSYGEMAVLAGLCFLMPRGWWRRGFTLVAASPVFITWAIYHNLSTTGHVIAFLLGAALAPRLLGSVKQRVYRAHPALGTA
jgi:hypothetical protein